MNTKFIRDNLYEFKKDFGVIIRYITVVQSEVDIDTGVRSFIKTAFDLPAVMLPRQLTRKFIQDIGYLAANKNFTYGALNDYMQVKFIIDRNDIPKDLDISIDGYLTYNNKRYEKVDFDIVGDDVAFIMTAKEAEGGKAYNIVTLKVGNSLQFQDGASYELN
jgi:hypothetical protein